MLPCRPEALAANITELLVWLFTTGSLRLYWHSAHLHQLPLALTLLWSAKAACSVAVAALQLSADSGLDKASLQVDAVGSVTSCIAVMASTCPDMHSWQSRQLTWAFLYGKETYDIRTQHLIAVLMTQLSLNIVIVSCA